MQRTAESSNSRKPGFRLAGFSETELPMLGVLGNTGHRKRAGMLSVPALASSYLSTA
jgi:hypothetical protein